jgi:hypothetical protein
MLVKTPAMKLAVELRSVDTTGDRLSFIGVANMMPCTVDIAPTEMRAILRMLLKPANLMGMIRFLLSADKAQGTSNKPQSFD